MTIYDRREEPRPTGLNACGLLLTGLIIAGVTIGALVLRPRRIVVEHVEQRDGWTARIMRIGRWSEDAGAWVGRSRYDLEFVEPDGVVRRYRMLIYDFDEALEFMNAELDKLGARRL